MTDRILMIEDDARLGAMVRDYLAESGLRVSVRETAAEGLATLAREPWDAVFTTDITAAPLAHAASTLAASMPCSPHASATRVPRCS